MGSERQILTDGDPQQGVTAEQQDGGEFLAHHGSSPRKLVVFDSTRASITAGEAVTRAATISFLR
jgi:hypothetical protein